MCVGVDVGVYTHTLPLCPSSLSPCALLPSPPGVLFVLCREEGDKWILDGKLESHTDWVRDVAWAPSIGLPVSRIASCSQDGSVIVWRKDETEGGTWTPQVMGVTS